MMTDGLNYILQRIECVYMQNNKNSLMNKDAVCLQDEDLPCNCITGIVVNYAAFLTRVCLFDDAYNPTMAVVTEKFYYVQCHEKTNVVCPVIGPLDKNAFYVVSGLLCEKSKGIEAYIPFHSYTELERIETELIEYSNQHVLAPDKTLYLEFWIRFLSSMRVRPLDITSKAFLFMAIYFFPNRTLKVIWDFKNDINSDWIEMFLRNYLNFLLDIRESKKLGFQQRFVQSFKRWTAIDISAFVEKLSIDSNKEVSFNKEKDLFLETLITAYIHNMNEISRSRGYFKRFCLEHSKNEDIMSIYNILRSNSISSTVMRV